MSGTREILSDMIVDSVLCAGSRVSMFYFLFFAACSFEWIVTNLVGGVFANREIGKEQGGLQSAFSVLQLLALLGTY